MTASTTLILPGLYSSGPDHWQTRWERMDPECTRVVQKEWIRPRCADWVETLDLAIRRTERDVVLVGHSSACALVAHWTAIAESESLARVRGALLVAPSDPEGPNYPLGPSDFAPMPRRRLPFPSTVVASANDQYIDLEQARAYAEAWGSAFVEVGDAGHINGASNLGEWPAGYELLKALRDGGRRTPIA